MPINRAWFNALVDDDGTGNTGTVWNKATITGLLDAIDGLFEVHAPWSPTLLFNGASTGWGVTAVGRYTRVDRLVALEAQLTVTAKGSAVGTITIGGLPYPPKVDTTAVGLIDPANGFNGLTGPPCAIIQAGVLYLLQNPPAAAGVRLQLADVNLLAGAIINLSIAYRIA
jgi:hypothetical protein